VECEGLYQQFKKRKVWNSVNKINVGVYEEDATEPTTIEEIPEEEKVEKKKKKNTKSLKETSSDDVEDDSEDNDDEDDNYVSSNPFAVLSEM